MPDPASNEQRRGCFAVDGVARATGLAMAALLLLVAGCNLASRQGDRARPDGGGGAGGTGGGGGAGGTDGGGSSGDLSGVDGEGCSDSAKLIYVLDEQNKLSSFQPATLTFTDIGPLACPAFFGSMPFSMAVDRNAIAWVVYTSRELFRVDTSNAGCTATTFQVGQQGMDVFGMGFATNAPGGQQETLFLAGGTLMNYQMRMGPVHLGSLAFPNLAVTSISTLNNWAEMTGTAKAELWGFFGNATPPRVAQIDKTNGSESHVFSLPSLQTQGAGFAFAHWGGDFWIFLLPANGTTSVYRLHPPDGSLTTALSNTGRHIVGAGVSTCAPIVIQ